MKDNTMGMFKTLKANLNPTDTRGIVVIIFSLGLTAGLFVKIIEPAVYTTFAAMAMGWWFSKKTEKNKEDAPE